MRRQTYGDKQREEQLRKKQEELRKKQDELFKKQHPESAPVAENEGSDKSDEASNQTGRKDPLHRRTA